MLFASVTQSKESTILSIDILEYGMFDSTIIKKQVAENTSAGVSNLIKDFKLIKQTTDIPGKLGNQFGLKFAAKGIAAKAKIKLSVKLIHPMTVNPETKKEVTEEQWTAYAKVAGEGCSGCTGWTFDYPWEIVPGKWIFQLWYEDNKLAEKTFTIHLEK